MEEAVPFPVVRPWAVEGENFALVVYVSGVEELVVVVAGFAAAGHVGADVVEVAEAAGEVYVRYVVQAGAAEDAEAVLMCQLDSVEDKVDMRARYGRTLAIAARIS